MPDQPTLDEIETTRKRLIFRSWHRGTREMDLLLGSFANKHVPDFDESQLAEYAKILKIPDPDLYGWITGQEKPPANMAGGVMDLLLAHRAA